ncbi:DUF3667 domain-containing protein [Flavobacterium sp. ASW18X]|uniref:DUF3667 domain-containing protein n=1 Tax=Flavobacterium sp. ASW18X TaxID=2572595 RepID=UPI0010AEA224|nr:DUF3667 domain-containing protein [Flavobacterium sp. ASW18X]TKD62309.1 DUF3667 domain-containing protein [Flavobacterium sp. ASW18X]
MKCKNCLDQLRTDYSFCPNCGAKVIRNRITMRNLWYDFTERFFNLDNTFIRTFTSLFTDPKDVILGYIKGTRKKYMNPISYFMIAVTLGGLFFFLQNKFFPNAMSYQFELLEKQQEGPAGIFVTDSVVKWQKILAEYQSIFYMLMIPIISLISRLVFINRKELNLSEHFVLNLYGYSQISIIVNLLYIAFIWNSKAVYYIGTYAVIVGYIGYYSYILKQVFELNRKQLLIKIMFFLGIGFALYLVIIVAIAIYLFAFTDTFKNLSQTASLAMNWAS